MPAFVAIFPHAIVGFTPMVADVFRALPQHFLHVAIEPFVFADEMGNGFDHFAVKIELQLFARRIAHVHRSRAGVSI